MATTTITFPTDVKVGQSGLGGSITLRNQNNGFNAGDANLVCNPGDAVATCLSSDTGIVLTPSCGALAGDTCAPSGADPGVFAIAPTATGRAARRARGSRSTPRSSTRLRDRALHAAAGGHARHAARGRLVVCHRLSVQCAACPGRRSEPAQPGTQTAQATEHTQVLTPFGPSAPGSRALDTSKSTVAGLGSPTISAQASPAITLGAGSLSDSATVGGRISPLAGATVDFRLYGPDNPTCAGAPVFVSTGVPYPAAGGTVTSAAFEPAAAGTYAGRRPTAATRTTRPRRPRVTPTARRPSYRVPPPRPPTATATACATPSTAARPSRATCATAARAC